MINLKYPQKEYIEEKLIHLSSKEILEYIEDNKEAELFIIHGIIYYNNLHFITVEKSNCQTLPLLTTQLEILYQKLN